MEESSLAICLTDPDLVAARVHTRSRVTTDLTAREVQEHKGRTHCVPTYILGHGGELPLQASQQALGRHYFTW